eukprot:TRINITY_DN5407_c0_g2_i2.p1 TRINITY_DN5407_c0_g2~~TRINITY_DN5407_c0_g2_i2.p1  ORF type:complete len:146 (-),score=0.45 TRINITY_DN5407_c0_g2_i2:96-533(-)
MPCFVSISRTISELRYRGWGLLFGSQTIVLLQLDRLALNLSLLRTSCCTLFIILVGILYSQAAFERYAGRSDLVLHWSFAFLCQWQQVVLPASCLGYCGQEFLRRPSHSCNIVHRGKKKKKKKNKKKKKKKKKKKNNKEKEYKGG